MKAGTRVRVALGGLSILALIGCAESDGFGQPSFKAQYLSARTALEKGNYEKANKLYARMLSQAGPLDDRIRLEYAHSQLRAGAYDKAAEMARALATRSQGSARGAALSVQGTADHEVGLRLLSQGDRENGAARLKVAQKALEEVFETHPDLDPLGSLAGRSASISSRLKSLP